MTFKDIFFYGVLWAPLALAALAVLVVAVKLRRFHHAQGRGCAATLELAPPNIGSLLRLPTRESGPQTAARLSVICERFSLGTDAQAGTTHGQHSGSSNSKSGAHLTSTSSEPTGLTTQNLRDGGTKSSEAAKATISRPEPASKHSSQAGMEHAHTPASTPQRPNRR